MRWSLIAVTASITLSLSGGSALAQILEPSPGPEVIGPMSIVLNDNAVDACWTNLRETREYAEEKLRIAGYDLSVDDAALVNYTLMIEVTAARPLPAPTCIGAITVMVGRGLREAGIVGIHVIAFNNAAASSRLNGNLNQSVIEIVQKTVDSM